MADRFTYRSARSGSFVAGISAALLIETAALHFALVGRLPVLAWTLTIFNVAAIGWFVRDYVAMGRGALTVDAGAMRLTVGRRFDVTIATQSVAHVFRPTYRDLPTPGTNQGRDYVNLTRPAQPNVLIALHMPMQIRMSGGIRKEVARLALHLDDPQAFIATVARGTTAGDALATSPGAVRS